MLRKMLAICGEHALQYSIFFQRQQIKVVSGFAHAAVSMRYTVKLTIVNSLLTTNSLI